MQRKSVDLSPKSFFWTSKQPFAKYFLLASRSVSPVAIPEIFAQTQGSDYWQLIHCAGFDVHFLHVDLNRIGARVHSTLPYLE